jgi:predicted RNase H-like nuclease (RuvC/YqgF family)
MTTMSNELITAVCGATVLVIGAAVAAYLKLRKGVADLEKGKRNGVIEEWREVVDLHGRQLREMEDRYAKRMDAMSKEIIELRAQITALYTENAQLRQMTISKDKQVQAAQHAVDVVKDKLVEASAEAGRLAGRAEKAAEIDKGNQP